MKKSNIFEWIVVNFVAKGQDRLSASRSFSLECVAVRQKNNEPGRTEIFPARPGGAGNGVLTGSKRGTSRSE
ncbi:MAG: hypothetical protein ACOY32_14555 [Thermodesulfobacteriota bacterium]